MLNIIISGCKGHMGKIFTGVCDADAETEISAGFELAAGGGDAFPVFANPQDYDGPADVLVDFSSPSALEPLLRFCVERKIPAVLCTTGYGDAQLGQIRRAADSIPIFKSANMSLGVNLLLELVKRAALALGEGFDVEIVEKHHNRKIDAPSGTALMLADAAKSGMDGTPDYIFDRSGRRAPRGKSEIGISAVRGGTIPGEHSVIFAGADEIIEFRHSVYSREVFAAGALRAAKFLAAVPAPGMYDMRDAL